MPIRLVIARSPGWLLGAIALAAPWFVMKAPGTSFSVVDLLLSLSLLLSIAHAATCGEARLTLSSRISGLVVIGAVFLFLGVQSSLEGVIVEGIDLQTEKFLAVVVQYAFVMIALPIWAFHWLTVEKIWPFLRYIALGYIVPMMITLFLMYTDSFASLREIFFSAGRAQASFGNSNAFAAVLVIVIPIYGALCLFERGWWRIVGLFGLLFALACLALTASFGGALMLIIISVIGCIVLLLKVKRLTKKDLYGLMAIGIIILIGGVVLAKILSGSPWMRGQISDRIEIVNRLIEGAPREQDEIGSMPLRMSLIKESITKIIDRNGGLWGHGLGQSRALSIYGYDVHLVYLQLWMEGGLLLTLLYVAYLVVLTRNALKLAAILPVAGMVVTLGVITIVLFGLINPHIYLRYFWLPVLPAFINWQTVQKGS
jgi:hypothetical protein